MKRKNKQNTKQVYVSENHSVYVLNEDKVLINKINVL